MITAEAAFERRRRLERARIGRLLAAALLRERGKTR
jgi:hypothetical protein